MAELISSIEGVLDVDFALLAAWQDDAPQVDVTPGRFATTFPGHVHLSAGRKHATMNVRVERWDARPEHQPGWQDRDELVFAEVPDGGPLRVHDSFGDPSQSPGLDVSGLGWAHLLVMARGRHRYPDAYSELGDFEPEEWLLQFYPAHTATAPDPLTFEPRRLAGGGPHPDRSVYATPWREAVHGWDTTGWGHVLSWVPGGTDLKRALTAAKHPAPLAEVWGGIPVRRPKADSAVDAARPDRLPFADASGTFPASFAPRAQRFSEIAGVTSLVTWDDLATALFRLGLLIPWTFEGHDLIVPNPAPPPAWEDPRLTETEQLAARRSALSDYSLDGEDIENLVRWAPPEGVRTTAIDLAVRLGTPPQRIPPALDYLAAYNRLTCDTEPCDIRPDTLLTLTPPG